MIEWLNWVRENVYQFWSIIGQIGHDVGGNFNIHVWACSGISALEISEQVILC